MDTDALNEALGLARKMKNAFKAFEDIEKLVQAQAAVQGAAAEIEAKTAKLKSDLSALPAAFDEAKSAHDAKVAALGEALASARNKLDSELALLSDEKKKAQAVLGIELGRMSSMKDAENKKLSGIQDAIAYATDAHAEVMKTLATEEDAKRATLAALQAEIDALKQKFS